MKIIGLMLARNEEWVFGLSIPIATLWTDELVVLDHGSDGPLLGEYCTHLANKGKKVNYYRESAWNGAENWDEMQVRQKLLDKGREHGGTHFAIIDADEILTASLLDDIHGMFYALEPGELLELPMIAVRNPKWEYQNDNTVWSNVKLTVGFRDASGLHWSIREDGYQHHSRPPKGSRQGRHTRPLKREDGRGGVMHLQFANRQRLLAKHVLYRMVDHVRWPGRRSVDNLNRTYDLALNVPNMKLDPMPKEWLADYPTDVVEFDEKNPWHEMRIFELLCEHGREAFAGLDLKGY